MWYIPSSSAGIWFTQDTCASMKLARYWASGRVAKRNEAARVLLSADLLAKSIPSSRLLMAWTSSIDPLTFWLKSAASLLLVSRCSFWLHDERQGRGVYSPIMHADNITVGSANYDPHVLGFLGNVEDSLTFRKRPVLLLLRRVPTGAVPMRQVGRHMLQQTRQKFLEHELVD